MPFPPAADQLFNEVNQAHTSDDGALMTVVGEPDGLGVHRVVSFDEETSKWLHPILNVLVESDERIAAVGLIDDEARVVFVPDTRADFTHPFRVGEVKQILEEDDTDSVTESADPPPKKKAAKKAAPKK